MPVEAARIGENFMSIRRLVLAAALVAAGSLGASGAWAQDASVIAPGLQGQVQCYEPDTTRKVCRAVSAYLVNPDGTIDNPFEALISVDPVVTMLGTTRVTVRGNAVCGPMTRAELDRFVFTISGARVPDEQANRIRETIASSPGSLANEVCTTYTPTENGAFRADAVVDGVSSPEMAMQVIWVRPDEGYRVAP